jgi:hypothetical protein
MHDSSAKLDNLYLASRLIRRGLRVPIVQSLTGVNIRRLRAMWAHAKGSRASRGKLPEACLAYINNRDDAAMLTAFAVFYRQTYGTFRTDADRLLDAVDEFSVIVEIDINAAYYVLRDLSCGIVSIVRCSNCDGRYIHDPRHRAACRCPFCGSFPTASCHIEDGRVDFHQRPHPRLV